MISVDDALTLIDQYRPDWGEQSVDLSKASGHILAKDIIAPRAHPAQSLSIMDGYAIRRADHGQRLSVIGESRAGAPFDGRLEAHQAVRIFTGAVIPRGADQVEIQENAAVHDDNTVSFTARQTERSYIRPAGADFNKGDILFRSGTRVTPAMILSLATCNLARVKVKTLPTIALLSSGDELKPVGSDLKTGEIINSISPALTAKLNQWGLNVIDLGTTADDPNAIINKLQNCAADIIVPIGAASVGDYDFMKPAALKAGFTPVFSKIAVKPGKPTWLSKRGEQCILGLPGNPSSAWVCAHIFLYALIFGQRPRSEAKLARAITENGARETFLRAQAMPDGRVSPLSRQDSGLVTPLFRADCLLRRPAHDRARKENETAEILRL